TRSDYVIAANGDSARARRLDELMAGGSRLTVGDFQHWQHDVVSWTAGQLVPLLSHVHPARADVEAARARLIAWDRRVTADSSTAALYVLWEQALVRTLAEKTFGGSLARDYLDLVVTAPAAVFERLRHDDDTLVAALAEAVGEGGTAQAWGALHRVLFAHPLAVTDASRRHFNVG